MATVFNCVRVLSSDKFKPLVIEQEDGSLIIRIKGNKENRLLFITDYEKRGPYAREYVDYIYDAEREKISYSFDKKEYRFLLKQAIPDDLNKDGLLYKLATTRWVNKQGGVINGYKVTDDKFAACVYAQQNFGRHKLDKFFEMVESTKDLDYKSSNVLEINSYVC